MFITADDVARPIPAIAQNAGGGLRFLPVAQHELRAAHDQLARFAGGDFAVVRVEHATVGLDQRLPNRFGSVQRGMDVADVSDRRGFCHAVALVDGNAGEFRETAGEFGSERGGPGFYPSDFVVLWKQSRFSGLVQRIEPRLGVLRTADLVQHVDHWPRRAAMQGPFQRA